MAVLVGSLILLLIVLIHDASTYSQKHIDRVPVNPLALAPRRGGPKNLPIIEVNIDDKESDEKTRCEGKPRLVILGGGWGAVSMLKTLPPTAYNVTLIAPDNYFCFTPLLPSACVGTVEPRSLVEPLRRLVARVHGHFLQGAAVDICMTERLLEVEVPTEDGPARAYVPYDKLVIAVGSRSNDHGVKGLEHCYQLKTIPDAQAIRRRIMMNLEMASLPTTTPEQRKHLLSFVVCGGGPTGVEFAAELSDMLNEDVLDYYPKILKSDMSVTIIQSRDHILNTYSEKISDYAEKHFQREEISVVTNARVSEVTPNSVRITVKDSDGKLRETELPASIVLWSTGIAMQPFTRQMVELLPNQFHSKAVQVDAFLRVEGAPKGTIYALGDAATIHLNMLSDLLLIWEQFDENRDDKLSYEEWTLMAQHIKKKYPLTTDYLAKIRDVFKEFDTDERGHLSLNQVADMFIKMSSKATALPATAQVASQQGEYLGHMFGKLSKQRATLEANHIEDLDDEAYYRPFKYRNLGTLAYIGNSAAFDVNGYGSAGGLLAMYAWRSVYWSMQVSMRTRFMLMLDWVKRGLFGRDLSKF
jgi:NADH dehydrogenase